jgi:hypothetical protein
VKTVSLILLVVSFSSFAFAEGAKERPEALKREEMKRMRKAAEHPVESSTQAAANHMVEQVTKANIPEFPETRILKLSNAVATSPKVSMVADLAVAKLDDSKSAGLAQVTLKGLADTSGITPDPQAYEKYGAQGAQLAMNPQMRSQAGDQIYFAAFTGAPERALRDGWDAKSAKHLQTFLGAIQEFCPGGCKSGNQRYAALEHGRDRLAEATRAEGKEIKLSLEELLRDCPAL